MISSQPKLTIAPIKANRYTVIIALIFSCLANPSCNRVSDSEVDAYRILNKSLIQAIDVNNNVNLRVYSDFDESLRNPTSVDNAKKWQSKMSKVKERSDKMVGYLTEFRNQLLVEGGSTNNYPTDSLSSKQLARHSTVFSNKRAELKLRLQDYMSMVVDTGNVEWAVIAFDLAKLKKELGLIAWNRQDDELNASKVSIMGAIALLNACEANIRLIEHALIKFMYRSTIGIVEDYTKISMVITMNSTAVRGGEKIEVYAGVGEFTLAAKPEFIINGKVFIPDRSGVAVYSISAPTKKGKYSIPVKAKYWDSNGERQSITKKLEFEVVDCSDKRKD